jgi:hypothetical protein
MGLNKRGGRDDGESNSEAAADSSPQASEGDHDEHRKVCQAPVRSCAKACARRFSLSLLSPEHLGALKLLGAG